MLKELSPADQVILSLKNTLKSFGLISKLGLTWVYIAPVLVYMVLLIGGFAITNNLHDMAMSFLQESMDSMGEKEGLLGFLFSATSVLTWIIIKISVLVIFGLLSGYLTLIVLSPLLTYVAEKIESELSGQSHPFKLINFLKDVLRAILIALRNAGMQTLWTILLLILSFIPLINLITAPALVLLSAYFYGFSFIDYYLEIKKMSMSDSVQQVRRMKWLAVCLGGVFLFVNMVPWIGALLSCFFVFHLVSAATVTMQEAPYEYVPTEVNKEGME